jgi:hypothetical protein
VTGARDSTTSDAASPKPAADDAFIFDGISVRAVAAASQNGDSLLELLSEKERERARAFADESDRIRFVGGRALLRSMLCEHTGIDARAWRFGNGDKGKPFVEAPEAAAEGLAFSVSHAGPGIACASTSNRSIAKSTSTVWPAAFCLLANETRSRPVRAATADGACSNCGRSKKPS